ncbi:MAG TPA: SagB family peptide dehydrogenase [Roseiflexaceae bacterium]|nr:SagB family peptide dehydrogenase [Roseiflexaceae bacterium]
MERQPIAELFTLLLAPHAQLHSTLDGTWLINTPEFRLPLGALSPALTEAISTLASAGATEHALARQVLAGAGLGVLTLFQAHLAHFRQLGLLAYRLDGPAGPLATGVPLSTAFRLGQTAPAAERFVLSRFSYCHREDDQLVLESSTGQAKLLIHDPQVGQLLTALARPCDRTAVAGALPALDEALADALLLLLHSSGALQTCDATGHAPEDDVDALRQWEFHDLLFHSRSRGGRHHNPAGRTFRFRDAITPLPNLKPIPTDRPLIPLPQPDMDALAHSDPPLTAVIEQRRSLRESARPPTLKQLGAFLYRSARVRSLTDVPFHETEGANAGTMELSSRPYPSGGALYELELYLSIHRCEGLEAGFYHYEPHAHALTLVRPRDQLVEQLLRHASSATALGHTPDILITLAARFQRMSWKYQSIAYATILKDVGTLYQTMYLVATAMGLSPCALGNGNAELFAAAAGTDYYAESSVGEFLLGGPPADAPGPDGP